MYAIGIDIAGITGNSAVTFSRYNPITNNVECVLLKHLLSKTRQGKLNGRVFNNLTIKDISQIHLFSIFKQIFKIIKKHKWVPLRSVNSVNFVIDAPLDLQSVNINILSSLIPSTLYQSQMNEVGKRPIDIKYNGKAPVELRGIILNAQSLVSHNWFQLGRNLYETYPSAILQQLNYNNSTSYKGGNTSGEKAKLNFQSGWCIEKNRNSIGINKSKALINANSYFDIDSVVPITDYTEDNFESILCSLIGLAQLTNLFHTPTCFGIGSLPIGYRVLNNRNWYNKILIIDKM